MESETTPQLIFDSKSGNTSAWRLPLFVGVSILGHVGMFYLFKVVTPTTSRTKPPEETVLVLRGDDPAAAVVLASLEDRSPAGMLIRMSGGSDLGLELLPKLNYTPTYANYRPEIQFQWDQPPASLPLLADAHRPILPKLEKLPAPVKPPPEAVPLAKAATPKIVLQPNLQMRGLLSPPLWPAEITTPEDDVEPHLFSVAVNAAGAIVYCLSDGMTPPKPIFQAVSRLRFTPHPGAPLEWGSIEVHW